MNRYRLVLILATALATSAPCSASWFTKGPKANPKERVPLLITQLKTDPDDGVRESAAKELRDYDPQAFPEMVPALMEALQKDAKPAVRSEAAQTLGKLRPIAQEVGLALENATSNDPSMRVRLQSRSSLWAYHFAGYRSNIKLEEGALTSSQPAAPNVATPASSAGGFGSRIMKLPSMFRGSKAEPQLNSGVIPAETAAPPLAMPKAGPSSSLQPAVRPASRLVPAPATSPIPALRPVPDDQGPILKPPM